MPGSAPRFPRSAWWAGCALALCAFAPEARAACPTSTINGTDTTAPTQSNRTIDPVAPAYPDTIEGAYDLVAGTLSAQRSGLLGGKGVEVRAVDLYTVEGLTPGQPVPLVAHLDFAGTGTSGSHAPSFQWSVAAGPDSVGMAAAGPWSAGLGLPLDVVAGQPFPVAWRVAGVMAPDGTFVRVDGAFAFLGLPPGARLESCQGYATGAVPAAPATWGSMKARYR